MSHLGDLVAALVDSELSHDARDRALAHIAGCAECRAEVDRQRRLKALLANQADPHPSADLQARLRGIADSTSGTPAGSIAGSVREPRPARARASWFPATAAAFGPAPARPAGRSSAGGSAAPGTARPGARRRTVRRLVAGSASALALTAALAVVGSTDAGGPAKVTPPVDRFLNEHTRTTARLPLGDAGVGFVEATFTR
jgi:anti-sigma factor RsiW